MKIFGGGEVGRNFADKAGYVCESKKSNECPAYVTTGNRAEVRGNRSSEEVATSVLGCV